MQGLLPEESLTKKLVTQSFRVYFFTVLAAPLGYFIRSIIANKLSIEEVGIFYSVMGLVTILASVNDLGLTESMQYYLPKYWIGKKYDQYKTTLILTFLLQIVTGAIGLIILYAGADRLAVHHFHSPLAVQLLHIFAWYFVIINVFQLLTAYFSSFQNIFLAHFLNFFKQASIICFIGFFRISTGVVQLIDVSNAWVYGLLITAIVGLIIFRIKYGKSLKIGTWKPNVSLLKEQSAYAWGVLLATNAGLLIGHIDQQFVVNFLGAQPAGIYANYTILLVVYGVLTGPLLALLFPIVTELVEKQQRDKYNLLQNLLYKYYSVAAIAIAGLFFALGPEIASIFFGTKFVYSGTLVSLISPLLVFNIMLAANFTFLAGLGKIKERVRLLGIALVTNILVNLICFKILHLELFSPLIATALSWLILWWGSFKKLHAFQPIHISYSFLIKNALLIIVLSLIIMSVKEKFFVASNAFRYENIGAFLVSSIIYLVVIIGANYKSLLLLTSRLKQFRSGSMEG